MSSKDDPNFGSADESPEPPQSESRRPYTSTRRDVLTATGAAVLGGALGYAGAYISEATTKSSRQGAASAAELPIADSRPGITWPVVPPRHTLVTACNLSTRVASDILQAATVVRNAAAHSVKDQPTATTLVGIGIEAAHELFPERCTRSVGLPAFDSDIPAIQRGGDLMVMVAAETSADVRDISARVLAQLGEHRVLWSQWGFRDSPTPHGTTVGGIGFIDGIANPRLPDELRAGVWVGDELRDTYVVVRRMRFDGGAFGALSIGQQEDAVGRRKRDGAPLSGGGPMDDIDLLAKFPDGRTKIATNAHARRAHPANIGRPLMLRRSYTFNDQSESGLLFVAALSDAETFVLTQRRLDLADELLRHAETTAGDCFFVPEELSAPH